MTGPGGIGKTSLAAEALWQMTDGEHMPDGFPDGVLFHSFYNQPQVEVAYEHIIRTYGDEPSPTPALAAQRVLGGKRAILLLDGAEDADDLGAILAVKGNCCALVTSRDRGDIREAWQDIDPLEIGDGAKLLQDWGGMRAKDQEAAERISELVGGLPMALRLAGQFMKTNEIDAEEYRLWLEESPLEALDQGQRQKESVPILLKRSLESVSEGAKLALGVVGLLAIAPFDKEVMAEALETSVAGATRWLGDLARFGIVRRLNGQYQVTHALVHTYARTQVAAPEGSLERLGEYYNRMVREQRERGLEGFTILAVEKVHVLRVLAKLGEEGKWQESLDLAWAIDSYLDIQGHWIERVQVCQEGLKAARGLNDNYSEGDWLGNLGVAYRHLGEVKQAIEYLEQALAISREFGDRRGEGNWLGNLGNAYRNLREIRRAIEYYEGALAISQEIGDRRGEGNSLGNLGIAYDALGEVKRAIEYYEQALAIRQEIGDRRGEGTDLGNLGVAYAKLGEMKLAIKYFEQALAISQEIGDRPGEGSRLGNLGLAYFNLGEVKRAIEYYERALAISQEIGDRRGEGATLGNLGNAYRNLGEVKRAIEYYEAALTISQQIGDQRREKDYLFKLGWAYGNMGEKEKGLEFLNKAFANFKETHSPSVDQTMELL